MTELIFVHRTVTKGWIRQEISLDHYKHKPLVKIKIAGLDNTGR